MTKEQKQTAKKIEALGYSRDDAEWIAKKMSAEDLALSGEALDRLCWDALNALG